jgi:hypothetical protein
MMACKGWQINRTASQVDLTPPEVFPTTTNLQVKLQFLVMDSPHLLGEGQDEHLPSHLIGFLLQLLFKDFIQILQPPVVTQDPLDPLSRVEEEIYSKTEESLQQGARADPVSGQG